MKKGIVLIALMRVVKYDQGTVVILEGCFADAAEVSDDVQDTNGIEVDSMDESLHDIWYIGEVEREFMIRLEQGV